MIGLDYTPILADFFRLMNINGAASVYRCAMDAGIFNALADGARNPGELAAACSLAERPTALLLEALAKMGVVEQNQRGFGLTLVTQLLLSSSYRTLGDTYWAHLPIFLKTGQPLVKMDSPSQSAIHYQTQSEALAWMSAPGADIAARLLDAAGALKNATVLDVGAGSAVWSLALARAAAGCMVTAVDWPEVLPIASATAKRLRLQDRLTLLPGNYHEVPLPAAAFDLAILGNITHLETPAGNLDLFNRIRSALKPGGRIAVVDILPGQPAGDLNRALYALGLALRTEHGRVHTPWEITDWLAQAGFGGVEVTPLETPPFAVGMITARKAQ